MVNIKETVAVLCISPLYFHCILNCYILDVLAETVIDDMACYSVPEAVSLADC
jgi:hypothetical protein